MSGFLLFDPLATSNFMVLSTCNTADAILSTLQLTSLEQSHLSTTGGDVAN